MFFHQFLHAPEFPKNLQWFNTNQDLSLEQLRGHVVVLDFWTYCCINCIHILPDLKFLEEKYKDAPVMVVGVHAAKFLNEENPENVASAIDRYEIEHPVVVDSQHQIWESFGVRAWPTFVVIDAKGYLRAHFSGEGHREELDKIILQLITEGRKNKSLAPKKLFIQKNPAQKKSYSTLSFPGKIFIDQHTQQLFISDSNHHRILQTKIVSPTQLEIIAVIGSGQLGKKDGSYSDANFNHPQGMALVNEDLYVCDAENHLLRKINLAKKTVETVAGTGEQASWGETGGLARKTPLSSPWDITTNHRLQTGNTFLYIAMTGLHQIWQYDPERQLIEAYVGSGRENIVDGSRFNAQLAQPSGVTFYNDTLFWADSEVSAIRQLPLQLGEVQTIVGHGLFTFGFQDGAAEDALFQHPLGLCVAENMVYVADTYNHALRQIDLHTHQVSTLIKRETHDVCSIDNKNCNVLPLNEPNDVKKLNQFLYIADTNNHLIRVFDVQKKTLETVTIAGMG